jgi:hypothetical protein
MRHRFALVLTIIGAIALPVVMAGTVLYASDTAIGDAGEPLAPHFGTTQAGSTGQTTSTHQERTQHDGGKQAGSTSGGDDHGGTSGSSGSGGSGGSSGTSGSSGSSGSGSSGGGSDGGSSHGGDDSSGGGGHGDD